MSDTENFTVKFYDDYAEIKGNLHLSQCVNMLLFFEQLGYNSVQIDDHIIRVINKNLEQKKFI